MTDAQKQAGRKWANEVLTGQHLELDDSGMTKRETIALARLIMAGEFPAQLGTISSFDDVQESANW